MASVPVIGAGEAVRAFQRDGRQIARQPGSHIIMVRDGSTVSLSVPNH